jgi:glycosyltransferase involved in cell wall biosynthesis
VKQFQPDVIHAHWWLPGGFVGALVSKFSHTPLVMTTHGTDVEQLRKTRWAKPLARFAFGQARIVTCGSVYLRERLMELQVVDAERVRVIPMPVNPLFVTRDWRLETGDSKFEIRNSKFEILCVARLTKQKHLDVLIDALKILRERDVNAHLQIVGDGDQREFLEHKTRELQLDAQVEFLGMRAQTELPELYAQCDAFVLPSVREGMGLVLAEALLCGAPVIATNSGGVTDIVIDKQYLRQTVVTTSSRSAETIEIVTTGALGEGINKETGLLFPERDAGALADALEKYARDSAFAARLAHNGRALVVERFTPERVAAQFLHTYELARH